MIFSPEAIEQKLSSLDSILDRPELLHAVVSQHVAEPFSLTLVPRPWSPGGGATLFRIDVLNKRYFLKVKSHTVFVESRLESEEAFMHISSLQNEKQFLSLLASPNVPQLIFYEEQGGYSFLATEWLEPFLSVSDSLNISQLLKAWDSLRDFVEQLFSRGIVHTDLHEGNLCFRGDCLVVCDFEEARFLSQTLSYTESLDVSGINRYGNVGDYPSETGMGPPGLTCLNRLKRLFAEKLREKLLKHLQECHFDQDCPFNLDELQEKDARIYQSVDIAGLKIEGQRPKKDARKNILTYLLLRSAISQRRSIYHLDLGSNLGTFCLTAANCSWVDLSRGLEAFEPYVESAQSLAFLIDNDRCNFMKFVCGVDRLADVAPKKPDLCTMFSVYHHVSDRDVFLEDLAAFRPKLLVAEFAVQERYYPQHIGLPGEIEYIRGKLNYRYAQTIMISSDYHRPIVLFSDCKFSSIEKKLLKLVTIKWFEPIFLLGLSGVGKVLSSLSSFATGRTG